MPHYYPPRRSVTSTSPYTNYYPGVNPNEIPIPDTAESSALVPYSPQNIASGSTSPQTTGAEATKSTGGFSLPNLNDIKGIVDRLGGIEGILATIGKVQKVMQTVQQFAPMAKLITGLLPGSKSSGGSKLDEYKPPRRRRSKGRNRNSARKGSSRRNSSARGSGKSGKRRR
ncbi:hypothetical protein [Paenibacillus lentus]|uniref:Tyrosine protein kinase n=1 Tax=Paenibacillus lentus TaxID=1338368 RepID=A0A3Q8SEA3_9BACL|nr:hypothetical protein [Paenibacillus lentus]AZK48718.1 hypothetical protein EIM92_23130 [Paenibacillus lentus]